MIHGKDTMNALMTVTVMFVLNVLKTTGDCPRYCECKWKSGKESVLCANANMTEIPRHLDSGTQLLDLTGNRLHTIGPDEFFNASLLNLQKIFLSRCRLRFIEKSSFRKIINLVELDLSYNELHSIPSHTFEFITELRELKLNGNPIIRVLNNAFKMVPRLTKLDLSECRIGYVEIKAFQGLETSLEWLKLDKNKIVNIKPFALVNLGNLHGLELAGNPWNCSCGLRLLRQWMLKQNVPYSIPPVCKYPPRLVDRDWDKLNLDEFACAPRIDAVASKKTGEEGSNVTLACLVQGSPDPEVRWLRKNSPIANATASAGGGGGGGGSSSKPKVYLVQVARETSNLTILSAELQDSGVYVCTAENKAGKSEANITLTLTVKPTLRMWSSRMVVAIGVVSLLFAIAVGLLTFCAWSSRKRKFGFRHPVGGRDYDADDYEMNHKKPVNYNKIVDYGNHYRSNSTADNYRIPGKNPGSGNLNARPTELSQEGTNSHRDFSGLMQTSGSGRGNESGGLDSLKTSEADDRLNVSCKTRMSPDLHIPRLNGHQSGTMSSSLRRVNGLEGEDPSSVRHVTLTPSASFLAFHSPQVQEGENGENQHALFGSQKPQLQSKYPDLLELSKQSENLLNNNLFCTVPRKWSYRMRKTRQGQAGSESQSPLLAGSSADSFDSGQSCGNSRRPSSDSEGSVPNASLPASPGNVTQVHGGNGLEGTADYLGGKTPKAIKYKTWKLEKFLKEYRSIQDQLYKMKETCENVNEDDNLRYRDSSVEDFYSVNKKYLYETNNFDSPFGNGSVLTGQEDNNNPEKELKNKPPETEATKEETAPAREDTRTTFWSSGRSQVSEPLSHPFCQS